MEEEIKYQLSLLGLCNYKIDYNQLNWDYFFISASNNRILYFVANKLKNKDRNLIKSAKYKFLKDIVKKGSVQLSKTKETLKGIKRILDEKGIKYLICKTQRPIDYITFDVDLLVSSKNYESVKELFLKKQGKYLECKKKLQGDIIFPNMIRIDLHKGFFWQKSDFINNREVWSNCTYSNVFKVKCPTPNITVEAILILLNILYERNYIPLLDYYFLYKNKKKIDWAFIDKTSKEYGWNFAYRRLMIYLNTISYELKGKPFFTSFNKKLNKKASFPQLFSVFEVTLFAFERLFKRRYFRIFDYGYFLFAKIRYLIFKNRVPIYGHWYKF